MGKRECTGVPAGSSTVEVSGESVAVCRSGRGVPVVCLHAIGHGGGDFQPLADRVSTRYEVIRIDWPGHGRSGDAKDPPSARAYADLLAGILDRLRVERPIIIGCSIGGAAALLHAQDHPVRGLVLCDPGGLLEINGLARAFIRTFAAFFRAGERGAWWFGAAYALYYRFLVLPTRAAAPQRGRIIAAGRALAPLLRAAWESFGEPEADIRERALALDVPVWFAWARSDRVIPLGLCKPCIDKMHDATLTTFAGGHAAFLEQPDLFARGFLDFAGRLDRRAADAGGLRRSSGQEPERVGPKVAPESGDAPQHAERLHSS